MLTQLSPCCPSADTVSYSLVTSRYKVYSCLRSPLLFPSVAVTFNNLTDEARRAIVGGRKKHARIYLRLGDGSTPKLDRLIWAIVGVESTQ